MTSQHIEKRVLTTIVALAVVESLAAGWSYRSRLDADVWDGVRSAVEQAGPTFLANEWLGPRARMELDSLRGWDIAARPDLRGLERFSVLGLDGDGWSPELSDDLEDLPPPRLEGKDDLGPLTLFHYHQPEGGTELADLLDATGLVSVSTPAGVCKGGPPAWRCQEGIVELRVVEVDYRPRRCFAAAVRDGTPVTIEYPDMATGTVLRGHVGFDDFNRRLRSDAPVGLEISVDADVKARWPVTDQQGWWPFAVATAPGTHTVAVTLTPTVEGTWSRKGYVPGLRLVPCVELRSFAEGAP